MSLNLFISHVKGGFVNTLIIKRNLISVDGLKFNFSIIFSSETPQINYKNFLMINCATLSPALTSEGVLAQVII